MIRDFWDIRQPRLFDEIQALRGKVDETVWRAIDAAFRVETKVADRTSLYLGGRILEGGADNDEVYSFGTFAYAFGGVRVRW